MAQKLPNLVVTSAEGISPLPSPLSSGFRSFVLQGPFFGGRKWKSCGITMAQKYVNKAAALRGGECGDVGSKRASGCSGIGSKRESGCWGISNLDVLLPPSVLNPVCMSVSEALCKKKKNEGWEGTFALTRTNCPCCSLFPLGPLLLFRSRRTRTQCSTLQLWAHLLI